MAEKTIKEMAVELQSADWMQLTNYDSGYFVHWEHDNKDTIAHVEYGNMLIEDRDYLRHADSLPTFREAQDESTRIAYAHLQAQQELAALRAFVKQVADGMPQAPANLYTEYERIDWVVRFNMLGKSALHIIKQFNHEDDSNE